MSRVIEYRDEQGTRHCLGNGSRVMAEVDDDGTILRVFSENRPANERLRAGITRLILDQSDELLGTTSGIWRDRLRGLLEPMTEPDFDSALGLLEKAGDALDDLRDLVRLWRTPDMMEPGYGYHAERVEQLEPIVRALAARNPPSKNTYGICELCGLAFPHADDCPWRMACLWVEENPGTA